MPATLSPETFNGPFGGVNDRISARHLSPGFMADAMNVVLDAGTVKPRPGSVKISSQIIGAPLLSKTGLSGIRDFVLMSDTWWGYVDNVGVKLTRNNEKIGPDAIETLSQCRAIAYDSASDTAYVAYAPYNVRKITTISGTPAKSDLLSIGADQNLWDIAIDVANDKIYMLQEFTGTGAKLHSATLSTGADLTLLATIPNATMSDPRHLTIDITNQKLYVADYTDGKIYRYDTDGANETAILSGVTDGPSGVAVDEAVGRLYYCTDEVTDSIQGRLYSSLVNGTDTRELAKLNSDSGLILKTHFDQTKNLVYFCVNDGRIYTSTAISSSARVMSMAILERGLIGVTAGDFADDWIIGQQFNEDTGEVSYVSWFPATGEAFMFPLGYHAAEGNRPELIISNDRDTDPTQEYGFQSKFGVADFAYTGLSLQSAKGGFLIANGEGNGFFANYVMGNHKIRITYTSVGNATIVVNGENTALLADATTEEDYRTNFANNLPGVNQVILTKTSGTPSVPDPTYFDIEFIGGLSGQSVTVTIINGTASPTVSVLQTGGTETGHKMYLLPCGLTRPDIGDSTHDVQFIQTTVGAAGSTLDGVYQYVATYYSSILGLESPKSVASALLDPHVSGGPERVKFTVNSLPDTVYFEGATSTIPFLLCDRLRIYRRRLGNNLVSGEPDGLGLVDYDRFLVADLDIKEAQVAGLPYDLGDDMGLEKDITYRAPKYDHPPEGAQYVEVHGGRAHWAPLVDGLQKLYASELRVDTTKEWGFHYVRNELAATLENTRASDHHTTSLKSFGDLLLAHTNKDVFIVDTSVLEFGTYQARRLQGGAGCAGKRVVVETDATPDLGGRLIWCNDRGDVYAFNGGTVELLSSSIMRLARTLVRKTWQDVDQSETGHDTWYFASAALDPEERRIIFSAFVDSGVASNAPIQLVFDIDQSQWTPWNIAGWGFGVIRNLTTSGEKGRAQTVFSNSDGELLVLQEGKGDNGSTFAWHMEFGEEDFGTRRQKNIHHASFAFEKLEYGATDIAITLTATVKTEGATIPIVKSSQALDAAGYLDARLDALGIRTCQFKLSGTQADDQDVPRLVARELDMEVVGAF